MGLPEIQQSFKICLTVSTQYRRVTDSQMDRQQDILRRQRPRGACICRAGKK